MEYLFERRKHPAGEDTNERFISAGATRRIDWRSIGYYTAISFLGILLVSYAVSYLPTLGAFGAYDSIVYGVCISTAEEMFFRGFITDTLLSTTLPAHTAMGALLNNVYFKLILSAGIFAGYHMARYGADQYALAYVFFGGFILSWVAYKSQRLSPGMIAHGANNLLASFGLQILRRVG